MGFKLYLKNISDLSVVTMKPSFFTLAQEVSSSGHHCLHIWRGGASTRAVSGLLRSTFPEIPGHERSI